MAAPTPSCVCGSCRTCKNRETQRRRRERDPDAHRRKNAAWRDENRGTHNALQREYAKTPEGRRVEAERQKRDRQKVYARNAVQRALRSGELVRGGCARAGQDGHECRGRIEAHHADYEKPLEVEWLCSAGHAEADAAREQACPAAVME
jgi:hypothetical protein